MEAVLTDAPRPDVRFWRRQRDGAVRPYYPGMLISGVRVVRSRSRSGRTESVEAPLPVRHLRASFAPDEVI